MGCLTWPFKLLAAVLVLVLLLGAWLYRDRIGAAVRHAMHRPGAEDPAVGHPGTRALRTAEARVDSLRRARTDSVVLSANEMASLVGAGLDPAVRSEIDSLQVVLGDGRVGVGGVLDTRRIPRNLLGPLAGMIHPRERFEAGGPIFLVRAGRAEWKVDQLTIGSFPFPRDMVPRLVQRAIGGNGSAAIPFTIPAGISGLRIRPSGVTLYGGAPAP